MRIGSRIRKISKTKLVNEAFEKICELIPRFVYYSEYGNLDSDLYLPHVKENLEKIDDLTGKECMKARTLMP